MWNRTQFYYLYLPTLNLIVVEKLKLLWGVTLSLIYRGKFQLCHKLRLGDQQSQSCKIDVLLRNKYFKENFLENLMEASREPAGERIENIFRSKVI